MHKLTLVLLTMAGLLAPARALPQTDNCQSLILDMRIGEARRFIAPMPDSYQSAWISAYALFVEQLAALEKPSSDAFADLLKTARRHHTNSADYQQCLSDISLMRCYACFVDGSYLSSYAAYNQARQAVSELQPDDWRRQRFGLIELIYDTQLQNVAPLLSDNLTEAERTLWITILIL